MCTDPRVLIGWARRTCVTRAPAKDPNHAASQGEPSETSDNTGDNPQEHDKIRLIDSDQRGTGRTERTEIPRQNLPTLAVSV